MKKKKTGNVFVGIMYFMVSIFGGILLGLSISHAPLMLEPIGVMIAFYLFCIISASLAQIIIHEGGHLIFGLLSGYRFSSFRIGSVALVKTSAGMRLKRCSGSGTAGQCLMLPPEGGWENMKVFAYNMGGAFMNIITACIFFLISEHTEGLRSDWFGAAGTMGFIYAAMNGIPVRGEMLSNDGANMLCLIKEPRLKKSFWVQLTVNGMLSEGTRLSEMPSEWFLPPEGYGTSEPMVSSLIVLGLQRLMDQGLYEKAIDGMKNVLGSESLQGLYANILRVDLVTAQLLTSGKDADISILKDRQMKKFLSSGSRSPSVTRLLYCVALLAEGDGKKAQSLKKKFERIAAQYPYQGELYSERAMMERALKLFQQG